MRPVAPPPDQPQSPRYEIFHDVLAAPILDWRSRFAQKAEKAETVKQLARERGRVRRLRVGLIGVSLLLLGVIALAIFAFVQSQAAARAQSEADAQRAEALVQRDAAQNAKADADTQRAEALTLRDAAQKAQADAQAQQKLALSREVAANAIAQLESNPERALLLAQEAVKIGQTDQAEDALHRVLLDPLRRTFVGNGKPMTDAIFSPDGKWITAAESCPVTGETCPPLRVWDANTGKLVSETPLSKFEIQKVEFSPNGRMIVSVNSDAAARIWDAATGKLVTELKGHKGAVYDARFSPDGKRVVTASADKTAKVWDAVQGDLILTLAPHSSVRTAVFSPDGKYLVGGVGIGTIWDAASGEIVATLEKDSELEKLDEDPFFTDYVFSPDSTLLAGFAHVGSATYPSFPTVWFASTGTKLATFSTETNEVAALAFSPDSKFIVTAHYDGSLRLWNAALGTRIAFVQAHSAASSTAAFSPDGRFQVTAGADNIARLWYTSFSTLGSTGVQISKTSNAFQVVRDLHGHTDNINTARFSPDGHFVVTASDDGTVRLWEVNTQTELTGHTNVIQSIGFSADGKLLLTASTDNTARVWNVETGKVLSELRGHTAAVVRAAFSPDGQKVTTVSDDGTAQLWETALGQSLATFKADRGAITGAVFSPDGKWALTTDEAIVKVWDVETGKPLRAINPGDYYPAAEFSPDGKLIITSAGAQRIWDAASGEFIARFLSDYNYASYSPDGHYIFTWGCSTVVARCDNAAALWDATTRKKLFTLQGHTERITSARYSPDGKRIVTTSLDNTARVWDAATGRLITELKGHTDWVNDAAFSADGQFVVTASKDKTARLWDATNGKLLQTYYGQKDIVTHVAFSPDGKWLALAGGDGNAQLVRCDVCGTLDQLLARAQARTSRELTCEERQSYLHETVECGASSATPAP